MLHIMGFQGRKHEVERLQLPSMPLKLLWNATDGTGLAVPSAVTLILLDGYVCTMMRSQTEYRTESMTAEQVREPVYFSWIGEAIMDL